MDRQSEGERDIRTEKQEIGYRGRKRKAKDIDREGEVRMVQGSRFLY